jgi:pyridinium-3,5-bisthiocarboxylic acid mononucleotide nickel chelatase
MRSLYWDTFAGISGDMALGSLIALGADPKIIIDQLHSIGLTEFVLNVRSRQVHGIQATDIEVVIQEKDHQHHQRRLQDIEKMIIRGTLSERSRKKALLVFNVLAGAEAHVHGTTLDQIHFHEVGAVDSLVDIVGTCIALDQLDIDLIRVSTLPWSHGFVHCAHGILPLPAPATLMLLRGFKFHESGIIGELITPTGAALIRTLAQQSTFPDMTLLDVGYGAGKNDYGIPSLLRGVLGET